MSPDLAYQRDHLAVQVGQHSAQITSLHENQQRQDSTLVRIEQKVDKLLVAGAGALITGLATLVAILLTKHPG